MRVTIDKISAIDCFEGNTPFGCSGAADFYTWVSIDGHEEKRGPIDDRNNADPRSRLGRRAER